MNVQSTQRQCIDPFEVHIEKCQDLIATIAFVHTYNLLKPHYIPAYLISKHVQGFIKSRIPFAWERGGGGGGNNSSSPDETLHVDIICGRVSPSSSEIRYCTYSSHMLHECHPGNTEWGGQGNIESPVAIEIQRVTPIQIDPLHNITTTTTTRILIINLHKHVQVIAMKQKEASTNNFNWSRYNPRVVQPSARLVHYTRNNSFSLKIMFSETFYLPTSQSRERMSACSIEIQVCMHMIFCEVP